MATTEKTTQPGGNSGDRKAEVRRRATGAAHDTVERVASGAHETVDRVADVANRTAERLGEKSERLDEVRERMLAGTSSYVQSHPIASLGIAVAAGFLISRLLRS